MATSSTIFQQATIAETSGDWARTIPFNQFDPSTGSLLDAVFTTAGTIDVSASIENLAPFAATVNLGVAATITATVDGIGSVGSATPMAIASVNLGAFQGTFDGTLDFSGPSGTVLADMTASQTVAAMFSPGTSVVAPVLGTGTFDVNVSSYATSEVNGNGNLAVLLHGSAGATLSLRYDAATPGPGNQSDGDGVVTDSFLINSFPVSAGLVYTAPQVVTLPSQTSGWTATASFAQFNPALGTLDAILLNSGNTISGTFSAENLESVPAWVDMVESVNMNVALPNHAVVLSSSANNYDFLNLGAYDGAADFTGSSGQGDTIVDSVPTTSNQPVGYPIDRYSETTLVAGADLAAFTGVGTIALPVTTLGQSSVTGPSNLFTEITQQTGGTVSVSYVYTPFANPVGYTYNGAGTETFMGSQPSLGAVAPLDTMGTTGSWGFNSPGLAFIGGIGGTDFALANRNETFIVGAGANARINGFSLADGDRLNLSCLLTGAPLAHDLSNLGSFLSVTGQTPAPFGGGENTTLAVNGPGGAASLVLSSSGPISVLDLLNNNALVLPAH